MGWTSITNNFALEPFVLYASAIFWTLGYDTIYGLQDIHDDKIIGVKSTSIKFKDNVKIFVGACYSICVFLILILSFMMEINKYFLIISILFISTLAYQIKSFKIEKPESCLSAFKINNLAGFFICIFIFHYTKVRAITNEHICYPHLNKFIQYSIMFFHKQWLTSCKV